MGNCLFRKKLKINTSGNIHLLDDFDSSINDLNYVQYTQNNNFNFDEIQRTQNDFKIQFSNLQNKITKLEVILEQKLDNINKENNNKIYTINEQINLIHKDLESLVNNDKILLDNYQSIIDNNVNSSKIYKLIKEKVENNSSFINNSDNNFNTENCKTYQNSQNNSEQLFETCFT